LHVLVALSLSRTVATRHIHRCIIVLIGAVLVSHH
jgi:hypothetical protein